MTPEKLAAILALSFSERSGAAGETPLDELIRGANYDNASRAAICQALPQTVPLLDKPVQWRGLDVLIGQLKFSAPAVGDQIDELIAAGTIPPSENVVWAARCVLSLGSVLGSTSLTALESPTSITPVVREWLSLIMDMCSAHYVEEAFITLPSKVPLDIESASQLIRTFRRKSRTLHIASNAAVSQFLEALPSQISEGAARAVQDIIGTTFRRPALQTVGRKRVGHPPEMQPAIQFDHLFAGLERVAGNTDWGRSHATQPQAIAA